MAPNPVLSRPHFLTAPDRDGASDLEARAAMLALKALP